MCQNKITLIYRPKIIKD